MPYFARRIICQNRPSSVYFQLLNGITEFDDIFHGDRYFHFASFGTKVWGFAIWGPIKIFRVPVAPPTKHSVCVRERERETQCTYVCPVAILLRVQIDKRPGDGGVTGSECSVPVSFPHIAPRP